MTRMAALIGAWTIGSLAALAALPAAARPYLLLNADDHGFQALDLGAVDRSQAWRVTATLIEAPLAGIEVDGHLAPLIERRVEVDCASPYWRVVKIVYLDGQEKPLAGEEAEVPSGSSGPAWAGFGDDVTAPAVQAAACRREYRAQAVSRFRNLGEILANYQAAHAKAMPELPSEKELQDRRFRNGH